MNRLIASFMTKLPSYVIFLNGAMLALYGFWLLLPMETFAFSHLYDTMGSIAPEWAWGIFAFGAGLIEMTGGMAKSYSAIKVALMAAFLMWSVIAVSYWAVGVASATPIIVTFLALQSAGHYLNVSVCGESIK